VDAAIRGLDDSKQRQGERALSCARPTNNANLLTRLEIKIEVLED
jgi:hypothetical protein